MKKTTIFLILLLFGALQCTLAGAALRKEVSRNIPLVATGNLSIETYKGTVNVTTWDQPQLQVQAVVEPDEQCGDSERLVNETEIRIEGDADWVRIKSDYGKLERLSSWRSWIDNCGSYPFVHYTIKMPRTARLNIKDYKSEISVRDLGSDLKINSYKGEMDVSNINGSVDMETYKGIARVGFANLGLRNRVETYKGDITITVPQRSRFDLDSDVGRKGDLQSDFSMTVNTHVRDRDDRKFRSSVNGGGPLLQLKTHKGTFKLRQR